MNRTDKIQPKIVRAAKHVGDLQDAIQRFVQSKPYKIDAKPHPIAAIQHTTLYVSSIDPVPDEIAVIAGDAIHNLRSALDHLAWQLVEAGGGTPDRNTYFPICDGANGITQYAAALTRGNLNKMPVGAEPILQQCQPCFSGDPTLSWLHDLDRIDKHRLLIAVASTMDKWGVDVMKGCTMWFDENRFYPLEVGYEVVNIPTSTYKATAPGSFSLNVDVAFGKPEIANDYHVLDLVRKMGKTIEDLLAKFEPFLV